MPEDLSLQFGNNVYEFTYKDEQFKIEELVYGDEIAWKKKVMGLVKPDKTGRPTAPEGANEAPPLLITYCTKRLINGEWKPVKEDWAKSLPSRMQKFLFEKCREISGLKDEEESKESLLEQKKLIEDKIQALANLSGESEEKN